MSSHCQGDQHESMNYSNCTFRVAIYINLHGIVKYVYQVSIQVTEHHFLIAENADKLNLQLLVTNQATSPVIENFLVHPSDWPFYENFGCVLIFLSCDYQVIMPSL